MVNINKVKNETKLRYNNVWVSYNNVEVSLKKEINNSKIEGIKVMNTEFHIKKYILIMVNFLLN